MPDFSFEDQMGSQIAGVDEAGCGPWAGPVVAGAVLFERDKIDIHSPFFKTLNDSKTLSKKKRDMLFNYLVQENGHSLYYGVGIATEPEIDKINIRQAALLAMTRAVESLKKQPKGILADGLFVPKTPYPSQAIKKGDSLSYSVAAGSIIAKVTRDTIMEDLNEKYPGYGWDRNAGYGTAEHQRALLELGVTPHHRRSFAPVAKLLSAA